MARRAGRRFRMIARLVEVRGAPRSVGVGNEAEAPGWSVVRRARRASSSPQNGSLADQCSGWTEALMNSEERRVKMYAWIIATKASMIMMKTANPTQSGLRVFPSVGLKA